MDDECGALLTIGQLAARTGLAVRTVRFWSDAGVISPAERSAGGYRLYDAASVARLELVATLRELGVGLDEVRRILAKEVTVADVAAAHVDALDVQIKGLKLRRAILSTVAKRGTGHEEMTLMNRLARLSAQDRKKIIDDFLTEVLGDPATATGMLARLRDSVPLLPDDPTPEQVDAWVELAELVQDPGFRRGVRALATYTARRPPPAAPGADAPDTRPGGAGFPEFGGFTQGVVKHAGLALAAGMAPESVEAGVVVERILGGASVDRAELRRQLEIASDPRAGRYWELLTVINGWPPYPEGVPTPGHLAAGLAAHRWLAEALRVHS
jgi:DNA-binding transcriptional MerR regulator